MLRLKALVMFSLLLMLVGACTPVNVIEMPSPSPSLTLTAAATLTATMTQTPTATPKLMPTTTPSLTATPEARFSFVVTSDMSHYSAPEYINYPNFFAALLGYVEDFGPGDFMISAGDVIPAADARWTIDQVLGTDYLWFPVPGNHDFGWADINFLQNYDYDPNGPAQPNIVNWGPSSCPRTTYSFDYLNAHFIALNVYCDEEAPWGIDGSISDILYEWLLADLTATTKEHIFVVGHEPAYPQPDSRTGLSNHLHESLDQYPQARDRFWAVLQEHHVVAYFCGHTHGYSAIDIGGVWQIDAGQAMGVRAAPSPGTFLIISVAGSRVHLDTYRGEEGPGFAYFLEQELNLKP